MVNRYKTSNDFKKALTARLQEISKKEGIDIQRLQRRVAFDRLLCRLFNDFKASWILKGGHALELRINEARATIDIDLAMRDDSNEEILQKIQEKASLDLQDYFEFVISENKEFIQGPPYGGVKFHVIAQIAGVTYVEFNIDIGIGDAWIEPYENVQLQDWLNFADIKSISIPVISKEQHFAEKLHAYTLPRESNSRVKDFFDLYLLIRKFELNRELLNQAIILTFERRKTHEIPRDILPPPDNWEKQFKAMAMECKIKIDIVKAYEGIRKFYLNLK
ncbi:MAG: nucleotidyl transferase AbiEii/AbiGii toxin family protein [Candidatus Aureabacteria bacterium]|nr:nucleotidyl transferase AbiEii/AbiGii toxin family protein [Candidatus Auribacterota bacterium]